MNLVEAFLPLTIFWLACHGICVAFNLALAVYRTRRMPSLEPVQALGAGVACLYIATTLPGDSAFGGWALFMSGFAGFSAGAWSCVDARLARQVQEA